MKISASAKSQFAPHPEYTGPAVCVDVTPLRKVQTDYGEKEKFRIVFETPLQTKDGQPCAVWSQGFTPSLGEKSGLRKFMKGWLGRDLTEAELTNFETEDLIGRPAFLVIVHNQDGENTYANIAACTPFKGENPPKASGKFTRAKDREQKPNGQAGNGATYRRTAAPAGASPTTPATSTQEPAGDGAPDPAEFLKCKVHCGRFKGSELRELSDEGVQKLIEHWLPAAKAAEKPTADDRRLIAALEWYVAKKKAEAETAAAEAAADDVPY